jgi:hypothetical protein
MNMKTRFSSIIKKLLIRIIITAILFYAKQYFSLDLINDLVDKLLLVISAFLLDFSPFTLEMSKAFFNAKSSDEGEGSNRDNNNNSPSRSSSLFSSSSEEASEVAEITPDNTHVEVTVEEPDNTHVEVTVEEPDEEERRLMAEDARLRAQHQAKLDTRFLDQLALDERTAQINERIRDFNNLRNQSQADESLVPYLTDIKRQIDADLEVLCEDGKRISDEILAYNAEINKWHLDLAKLSARKLEQEINERNSK